MNSGDGIVLVGQANWVRSLAQGLSEAGLPVEGAPLQSARQALSVRTWLKVARSRVILRVGFRPGARTWRGRAFDLALAVFKGRATVCCYWIGTDVMHLLADTEAGMRVSRWRAPATAIRHHLAGSEPLQRELAEVGIESRLVGFPWRTVTPPDPLPAMPPQLTVLSYVPDARSHFYGGPVIVEAARRLPHVVFLVMGGVGSWCRDVPANLQFLGWVDDPAAVYGRSSCVVRMVEHDSIGGTAVEGLIFGRRVLYSQPLAHAVIISGTVESLVDALQAADDDRREGRLSADAMASGWARREFDHHARFRHLAEYLRSVARPSEHSSR